MHLNKLSTSALMRLTILASLDLLMVRTLDDWLMLHPIFFLILVTLNLGLYAVMVYCGTLSKTLIARMLAGLAGVLAVIALAGANVSSFSPYSGRHRQIAESIERLLNVVIDRLSVTGLRMSSKQFWWENGVLIAYLAIDAVGLGMILATCLLARALHAASVRRDSPATPRPLDFGSASPL